MRIKVVTGFIPLAAHPRSQKTYWELGNQLVKLAAPVDTWLHERVADTWLFKFANQQGNVRPPPSADPKKDTVDYICVQHQKTAWMVRSLVTDNESDVFVWLDFGICHQPGVTVAVINHFLERLSNDGEIVIPGCWNQLATDQYLDQACYKGFSGAPQPCWRFCGSMFICPRDLVMPFHNACRDTAREHLIRSDNHVTEWEINTWARVEQQGKLPIRWYKADHNASMFTNYQPGLGIMGAGPAPGARSAATPTDQRDGARSTPPGHPSPIPAGAS